MLAALLPYAFAAAGAIASHCMAALYNSYSDRIAAYEREGRAPPEALLNGRHKLIAEAL